MKEKVVFKEKKKPLSASDKVFNVFNYLLFGLLTLICLYPFYYLIINTISANDLSANGLITLIPKGIHFENYKQVLQLSGPWQEPCWEPDLPYWQVRSLGSCLRRKKCGEEASGIV